MCRRRVSYDTWLHANEDRCQDLDNLEGELLQKKCAHSTLYAFSIDYVLLVQL